MQGIVEIVQGDGVAQVQQAGHPMLGDPARNDSAEMLEVGLDIDGNAVKLHPPAQADADGGDLVLA